MIVGGCYYCGDMGHYFRDCPKRSEMGKTNSAPSVQGPRVSGAPSGRGRGRGKTISGGRTGGIDTSAAQTSRS